LVECIFIGIVKSALAYTTSSSDTAVAAIADNMYTTRGSQLLGTRRIHGGEYRSTNTGSAARGQEKSKPLAITTTKFLQKNSTVNAPALTAMPKDTTKSITTRYHAKKPVKEAAGVIIFTYKTRQIALPKSVLESHEVRCFSMQTRLLRVV
jgi:hypothetical protein